MVYGKLGAVMHACEGETSFHEEVLKVRRILHRNRKTGEPLYVVVMPSGHMFIVSEYMPALTFEDCGARVFSVWQACDCNWHIVEQ